MCLLRRGREKKGASGGECYGTWTSSAGGSGPGFTNSCIHSGSDGSSGDNTVWYNYGTASAGTITGTKNINTATQSICPKGWTLPSKIQIDNQRNITSFSPTTGGFYANGATVNNEYGYWWSDGAKAITHNYILYYDGSSLNTENAPRYIGFYIRCVSEEKDVSDLTYMQDMTPSIANKKIVMLDFILHFGIIKIEDSKRLVQKVMERFLMHEFSKRGHKIIYDLNNPEPPKKHEINASKIVADYFDSDIVFIRKKSGVTPDLKIVKLNRIYELKSPLGNGKRTMANNLREASHQSKNVILDLSRCKMNNSNALARIRGFLKSGDSDIKRLLVIEKNGEILVFLPKKM